MMVRGGGVCSAARALHDDGKGWKTFPTYYYSSFFALFIIYFFAPFAYTLHFPPQKKEALRGGGEKSGPGKPRDWPQKKRNFLGRNRGRKDERSTAPHTSHGGGVRGRRAPRSGSSRLRTHATIIAYEAESAAPTLYALRSQAP